MKTAERILLVSLDLFNQHGEANLSSVDIANELEISPGNLYYHFKGKEIIIAQLFEIYQLKMKHVLQAVTPETLTVEEFFYYLYLILEISHDFRFLYRNPAEFQEKYPQVTKGFQKILLQKEQVFEELIESFTQRQLLTVNHRQKQNLVTLIGLISTQMLNYQLLKNQAVDNGDYLYQSLSTILLTLAPYMKLTENEIESLNRSILKL